MPKSSAFEMETNTEKLKIHKSQSIYHIQLEVM